MAPMKPPRKSRNGPRPSTPPVGPRPPKSGGFAGRGRPAAPKPERAPAAGAPAERPRFERGKSERPAQDRPYADRVKPAAPRVLAPSPNRLVLAPRPEAKHAQPGGPPRAQKHFTPRPERARAPVATGDEAPRGSLWLFGIHPIAAALANPARLLRRLLLTEEAEADLASRLRQPWPVQAERCDRARLEQLLGRGIVHQGAALLADPLPMPSLAQALERPGPVLVLDQINDPRNVGAILRSAAAFGVACVISQDRNAPDETGTLAKAASGALEVVPMLRAVNIARTLVALRAAGLWVIGLDASGSTLSGPALANRRVALVLGSEGEGLRRLTKETCDEIAGIAMPGGSARLESLNVSAAATVALYEMARRA